MEFNSIAIGIVVLVLFTAPILYVIINSSKSDKKIKSQFNKLCTENGVSLTNYEVIGSAIIGLDATLKKVMYSTLKDLENHFQVVDLSLVKNCNVKTVQPKKKHLELVELELSGSKFHNEIIVYQEDDETLIADPQMCLHEVQKWEQLIKNNLNK